MDHTTLTAPLEEWESISYPIIVKNIKFERDDFHLPDDTVIEIWRDDNCKLKGKIYGGDFYAKTFHRGEFIGKGNIIANDAIIGFDSTGNHIKLHGCFIGNLIKGIPRFVDDRQILEAEFSLDSLTINYTADPNQFSWKRFEWFMVSGVDASFDRSTFRKYQEPHTKTRVSVNPHDDDIKNYLGSSSSKDFSILKMNNLECIIAEVPERYLQHNFKGICFEFRDSNATQASVQFIDDLKHLVAFLLGCKMYYMGYTITVGAYPREVYLENPDLDTRIRQPKPPIPFTRRYEWSKFWVLINQLFPVYTQLQQTLQLNQAMTRYWTAESLPVGVNLPTLASALEIVANNYLKMTGQDNSTYLSKEEYFQKLEPEFALIKSRLLETDQGDIIVNKILSAFRKGPNEKMRQFFSLIYLKIGKDEKAALELRNKMAHAARDYSEDDRAYDDLVLTRVYESLFNRTILKILGYNEFYRDYSEKGSPVKHISLPSGSR